MRSWYFVPGPVGTTFFRACLVGSWERFKMVGFALSLSMALDYPPRGSITSRAWWGLKCLGKIEGGVAVPCKSLVGDRKRIDG